MGSELATIVPDKRGKRFGASNYSRYKNLWQSSQNRNGVCSHSLHYFPFSEVPLNAAPLYLEEYIPGPVVGEMITQAQCGSQTKEVDGLN